jgi:putative transposase
MQFQADHLYHIYNQGNNSQRIFFEPRNYEFFMEKMKLYILPYADVIAYCLMPNHFHWLVQVNRVEVEVGASGVVASSVGVTWSHADTKKAKHRSLNDSIGILLRSYTRAINKQEGRTGSLFREETKAICVSCEKERSNDFYRKEGVLTSSNIPWEKAYPQVVFNYIHHNPVKAFLVEHATDWDYSSAMTYEKGVENTLLNKPIAKDWDIKYSAYD